MAELRLADGSWGVYTEMDEGLPSQRPGSYFRWAQIYSGFNEYFLFK
jgi:hypothetical protein